MITTITFNPCIDKSATVPELISGKKLHCSVPLFQPGGGGINVARVIKRLGGSPVAIYPSGGYSGKYLNQLLKDEGVNCIPIEVTSHTRENFVVFETVTGNQFRFGMPGSTLDEAEWKKCIDAVDPRESAYIVVSGSLGPNVPVRVLSEIAVKAKVSGSRLVVDSSGAALKAALEAGVFLVKPNIGELATAFGKKWISLPETIEMARELVNNKSSEIVVVSLGSDGAIAVDKTGVIQMPTIKVQPKSVVGAGDSMLGGIVIALSRGRTLRDALQFGIACGAAATMNAGTELCHNEDVNKIMQAYVGDTRHLEV